MKLKLNNKKKLVNAALGKIPCDLVIKNAQIVNVFTGEIYLGNVGVYNGFIAHVQCDPDNLNKVEKELIGKTVIDANGEYLIPGLIDAHEHIESSMMTPRHLAEAVIPHGTTTVVTDPHEIANVLGVDGVKYMHDSSENIPMRQFILIPSCVPAVPGLENSGAVFTINEINELLKLPRVIGLAEVMDFLGVINNDDRIYDIVECVDEKGLFIEGHAPSLSGRELSAYLCGGPVSDHESTSAQEAKDKLRAGMYVDAREGSIAKNLAEIISGAKSFRYLDTLTLCTDDREAEDILNKGHMNDVLRKAVSLGMNPVDAIKCATINTAKEINVRNLGAIAPGYVADMILTKSLDHIKPSKVFFEGKLSAEDGKLAVDIVNKQFPIESKNTVFVDKLKGEDFKIKAPVENGKIKTTVIKYNELMTLDTDFSYEEIPVKNGFLDLSGDPDLKFVAVINRHQYFNTKAFGVVRNFGTKKGAVGSTVSHDCHNLTIVYDNVENALAVFEDLAKTGGGISCSINGKVLENLELPIGGLMSDKKCEYLAEQSTKMKNALRALGLVKLENPLLRIATVALPVIPNVKMSDLGIIDVLNKKIVDMF